MGISLAIAAVCLFFSGAVRETIGFVRGIAVQIIRLCPLRTVLTLALRAWHARIKPMNVNAARAWHELCGIVTRFRRIREAWLTRARRESYAYTLVYASVGACIRSTFAPVQVAQHLTLRVPL